MDAASGPRPKLTSTYFLAGLEAGTLGVLWMLVWLGLASLGQRRGFWAPENLMSTPFHPSDYLRGGLGKETFQGFALYLLIYSLSAAVFAMIVRERYSRPRILLLSVLYGVVWYYLTFQWLWKTWMPLVSLLHVQQATILGHLVYGTLLSRYLAYADRLEARPAVAEAPVVIEAPVIEEPPVTRQEAAVTQPPDETPGANSLGE